MITANQWYNIAQTAQVGTKSGIRIDFGTKYALFKVSVDYGNAVIAAVESNITAEETRLSVRIRYNNSAWFVDVRFSVSQETTLSAATYDNTGWEAVSPNTSVAGNTICIINDLTSLIRPSGGGESLFELMNVGTAEVPRFAVVPKKYNGVEVGIISNTFISMAGFEEPDDDTPVASSSLGDLLDVQITDPKSKDVLTYDEDLRKWVNGPGGLDETALGNYLTTNKYITQDALTGALNGYVTNEIYNTAITALNLRLTELETTFKEWFYYDDVNKAIRTKLSLIVDGTLSMGELGSGGGTEVASGKLADLLDVQITDPASGQILLYNEEKGLWVNGSAGLNEEQLEAYLKGKDYATNSALSSLQTSVNTLRTDFDNLNTLLNGNVGGIIDTWNEVVSFLDGYSQSDDLATILSGMNSDIANRVLIEDFEKLEGNVTEIAGYFTNGSANNALKLGGQLPSYYATADALNGVKNDLTSVSNRVKTFEDVIGIDSNGDVYIKGTRNFYTAGGTISMFGLGEGDSGEVASVSIKFEGGDVLYNPINGVITLPAYPSAGGGVADSVDWANVENKPNFATVATSGKYSDLTGVPTSLPASDVYSWAKAATKPLYAFSEITDKPTTLAGYGITDALQFANTDAEYAPARFLTAAMATKAVTKYIEWWQSGAGWFNHQAGKYIVAGANSSQFLKGDGSLDNTAYLPLSGGTIKGSGANIFSINRTDGNPVIRFEYNGEILGRIGYDVSGNAVAQYGGNYHTLIHSGNIGSQSVLKAYYIQTPYTYEGSNYISDTTTAETIIPDSLAFPAMMQNTAWCGGWSTTFTLTGYKQYGGGQLSIEYNALTPRAALRNYNQSISGWTNWREFAFLDSNVASATKLQTARTIWGQSFDGSANVLGHFGLSWYSIKNINNHAFLSSPSYVILGYETTTNGYDTYLDGNILYLRTDTSHTERMRITSGGNVLIGDTVDNGAKLQVMGNLRITRGGDRASYLDITVSDVQVQYNGWDTGDGYVFHDFFSNGNLVCRIDGLNNEVIAYGAIRTQKVNLYDKTSVGTSDGYLSLCSHSNEMCISGVNNDALYINYRPSHNGVAPTTWVWCAGSSDSRATFFIGELRSHGIQASGDLVVTGTIAMGTLSSSSDARLKDNIELLTDNESLSVLRRLRPSKWNWKSNGALSYGFIAQEVESVASCMVDRMDDEELGQKLYLQYNQLHAFEVGAIQHIDSEVEQLKRDLNTANLKIEKLENKLEQYRLCQ